MPKGYLIGHITVNDPVAYQEYIDRDTPIIAAHGGRPIARGGQGEVPEGPAYTRHVIFEFPSFAEAKALYDSPEYQQVAEIRRRTADSMVVLVEGVA